MQNRSTFYRHGQFVRADFVSIGSIKRRRLSSIGEEATACQGIRSIGAGWSEPSLQKIHFREILESAHAICDSR